MFFSKYFITSHKLISNNGNLNRYGKSWTCKGMKSKFVPFFSKLICHNPNLRLTTKGKGLQGCGPKRKPRSHISCSWECKRMRGNELTHSQMSSHFGNWSPDGFQNVQREIIGVKTHWINKVLISLEIF
jgi:hypothetical protein